VKGVGGGRLGYYKTVATIPLPYGEQMDNQSPKLSLNKNTTKNFKVKTNLKAGEANGANAMGTNSYNKIKWTVPGTTC
jgi:hypothetical protein